MLKWLETQLIYPAPNPAASDWEPDGPLLRELEFQEVWIPSDQSSDLHGWLFPHPSPRHAILFCHGNGEHIAFLGDELNYMRKRLQATVLAFDYRGYGLSRGKPSEAGLLADGEAAQRWLAANLNLSADQLVCWGRSLGGAIAVHVASQNGAAALILDRTFNSMVDVASFHCPWLPVRRLLRNRYPSEDRIREYRGPLIQIHGEVDRVVPIHLGKRLYSACPSQRKKWLGAEHLGHNESWPSHFWDEIDSTLSRKTLSQKPASAG